MKIIDLHCDTLYKMLEHDSHTYLENDGAISEHKLQKGGYMAQCFAVYTPANLRGNAALKYFNASLDKFHRQIATAPATRFAANSGDIIGANNVNKVAALLTVENAEFLGGDLDRLQLLRNNRIRILGLVHNAENCLAYPAVSQNEMPLKPFGREVVAELNSTDIYIDVSHLNEAGFWDAVGISHRPIIATHSAARGLLDHRRNLTDQQITAIANSGGIIGIPFFGKFLNGGSGATAEDIILHLKHIINLGGEECAAIGTDFDGMTTRLFIKDAADMQLLAEALIKELGFSVAEKICYKNSLKLL